MKAIKFLILFLLAGVWFACTDDAVNSNGYDTDGKFTVEKTVAVILPMEDRMEEHWIRCLDLYSRNLVRAFKSQDIRVEFKFEFYNELDPDLEAITDRLAAREDIYAVIGGLYSSNAAVLASRLSTRGKTLFTLATSEEFVRAYSSTGNLWAMTETDITQSEVLLAKVINYGGSSVALVAKEEDLYGKTFIDWFAFQARELGVENKGVYSYNEVNLSETALRAVQSGAEYVICVPSEIEDIGPMIDAVKKANAKHSPRLLFSDMAYGTDVLSYYDDAAEGIEGVAFGADPESGFDVSYRTFFNLSPTLGESQLYDAAMLLGYAAWYQCLHQEQTLKEALRTVVAGEDLNMGSWTGEDMSLVIDAMATGGTPYVRGASGPLCFDSKIFTSILSTTYYNFKVYDGQYIILDYNTSNGGNRTDATLAGWNWKASQMQDFDSADIISYPEHTGNWALLVATSRDWSNYRHQADVLAIYQQLKDRGYDDDHIILIAEDDIALHASNPEQGTVRVTPGGKNVRENVEIDYLLSELSSEDFLAIMKGDTNSKLPAVIDSEPGDNIFIFWSGHGVPGAMCWNDEDFGMTSGMLKETFMKMNAEGKYRKLLMMVEACYSGGVMDQCEGIPGMLFITAANGEETSKADIFNGDMKVWMSNRFTSTFIEQISDNPSISMRDLYYRLFINTVGSHVMVFNAHYFGNLYNASMAEFINFR